MHLRRRRQVTTAGLAVIAIGLAACSSSSSTSTSSSSTSTSSASAPASSSAPLSGTLNGSGSTFQLTFQQEAIQSFKSVQPSMTVNYSGVGSGTGRSNLAAGTTNFGGSDSTIPASELSTFKGTVLYFPILLGPITVSYNLSGLSKPLNLDATTIADIFEAKITTWNNSAIAADNPGVSLPSTAITICRRSDSSGTTQNFSEFLVKGAPSVWTLGSSSTIKWPAASRGGNGNGGVASCIKSTSGAIGYVDYADAKASGLVFASVKNSAGNYIAPSPTSATAAAAATITVAPNLTFSAIWSSGAQAYPITYQTWDLVYETQPNANDAAMLKAYIGYLLGPGQKLLQSLGYAPLASSLDSMATAQLSKIGM